MLFYHMSRSCTRRDELRRYKGGEGQQELLKGKFQGVGPVAIVFRLRTNHIQEDIDAPNLLRYTIQVRFHCLLIKRIYLRGVGHPATLVNIGSYLLNSVKRTTREKDR